MMNFRQSKTMNSRVHRFQLFSSAHNLHTNLVNEYKICKYPQFLALSQGEIPFPTSDSPYPIKLTDLAVLLLTLQVSNFVRCQELNKHVKNHFTYFMVSSHSLCLM